MRTQPDEVYEVMEWAYGGGCTPGQVHKLLADCGVSVKYNFVYKNSPKAKEHTLAYYRAYRKEHNTFWEDQKNGAPRYAVTGEGRRLHMLGLSLEDDFTYSTTMGILSALHNGETDERTIVERLRRRGVFSRGSTRGGQLLPVRRSLRRMEKDGLVRRAP